jgi:hypothetical protein
VQSLGCRLIKALDVALILSARKICVNLLWLEANLGLHHGSFGAFLESLKILVTHHGYHDGIPFIVRVKPCLGLCLLKSARVRKLSIIWSYIVL